MVRSCWSAPTDRCPTAGFCTRTPPTSFASTLQKERRDATLRSRRVVPFPWFICPEPLFGPRRLCASPGGRTRRRSPKYPQRRTPEGLGGSARECRDSRRLRSSVRSSPGMDSSSCGPNRQGLPLGHEKYRLNLPSGLWGIRPGSPMAPSRARHRRKTPRGTISRIT